MKQQKVQEIVSVYNIPAEAAALCVDDLGGVNQEKLAVAVNVIKHVKDGLTQRDMAEIETLKAHLKECQEAMKQPGVDKQVLAVRTIRLKDRIYSLGGRL